MADRDFLQQTTDDRKQLSGSRATRSRQKMNLGSSPSRARWLNVFLTRLTQKISVRMKAPMTLRT